LSKIELWQDWRDNYGKLVPKFIDEAQKGLDYTEWATDVFNEFFEKTDKHCVSSLKQGYFTLEERR